MYKYKTTKLKDIRIEIIKYGYIILIQYTLAVNEKIIEYIRHSRLALVYYMVDHTSYSSVNKAFFVNKKKKKLI